MVDLCIGGPPIQLWGCPPCTWNHVSYPPIRFTHPPIDEAVPDLLNQYPCVFANSRSSYHDFHCPRLFRLTELSWMSLSSKVGRDIVPDALSVVLLLCSAYFCNVYYIVMISVAKYLLLLTSPRSKMSIRERFQGIPL